MGDVARSVDRSFDDIRPGGGIGDREPAEHAVAFRSTFDDRLVCRCGVIALADHERGALVGPDDHVLSFDSGAGAADVETDSPAFDLDDEEGEAPESTALRIAAAREEKDRRAMEAMGVDPDDLRPEADLQVAVSDQSATAAYPAPTDREPVAASVDDPFAAKAARERAAKDARNLADRQRRVDRHRQRVERGERPRGFRPKVMPPSGLAVPDVLRSLEITGKPLQRDDSTAATPVLGRIVRHQRQGAGVRTDLKSRRNPLPVLRSHDQWHPQRTVDVENGEIQATIGIDERLLRDADLRRA